MAIIYVLNRAAFWTTQTVAFTFAEDKRVRLFSRCNTVVALGWGSAGLLVGGPLADIQTESPGCLLTQYMEHFLHVTYYSDVRNNFACCKDCRDKSEGYII